MGSCGCSSNVRGSKSSCQREAGNFQTSRYERPSTSEAASLKKTRLPRESASVGVASFVANDLARMSTRSGCLRSIGRSYAAPRLTTLLQLLASWLGAPPIDLSGGAAHAPSEGTGE